MTTRTTRTATVRTLLGLAVGACLAGPTRAPAMDAACFAGVVDLYMAQRTSAALDYLVCKADCRELPPSGRSACRLGCMHAKADAFRLHRDDATVLRVLCDGAGGDDLAARATSPAIPATCGPDLTDCSTGVRLDAKSCDRRSDDLAGLRACAATVSSAADRCAADFVDCAVPAGSTDPD